MSVIFSAVSRHAPRLARVAVLALLAACARDKSSTDHSTTEAPDVTCTAVARVDTLPAELSEASGITASRQHPGTLWVHNDGGNEPVLFAIDTLGRIHARIRIHHPDVAHMDFEDIAIARCGDRDCIYLGDIGDNYADKNIVRVLRFAEPDPAKDSVVSNPETFALRYPDGPHDAEALFVLPGEKLYLVTKGRNGPVALFVYAGALRADTVTLEHVQNLTPGIVQFPEMVTGAASSPSGGLIAIRTYSFINYYRPGAGDSLQALQPEKISLGAAEEFQGEGVAMTAAGTLFFVGERSLDRLPPPLSRMSCGGTENAPPNR